MFVYRSLRFARGDKTNLSGFEQDDYVINSQANKRTLNSLIEEFENVRTSTIDLFRSLKTDQLNQSGTANDSSLTVMSLGYIIVGHQAHHLRILLKKYLG